MTLIIGMVCTDGIVVGADAASSGPLTIHRKRKIKHFNDRVIVGVSGVENMCQIIENEVERFWSEDRPEGDLLDLLDKLRTVLLTRVQTEQEILKFRFEHTKRYCLDDADTQTIVAFLHAGRPRLFTLTPTISIVETKEPFFCAIGSGAFLAVAFLSFWERVYWRGGGSPPRPPVSVGRFAVVWALKNAIETSPGGISYPVQLLTVESVDGRWTYSDFDQEQLGEDLQNIVNMEEHLRSFQITPRKLESPPTRQP